MGQGRHSWPRDHAKLSRGRCAQECVKAGAALTASTVGTHGGTEEKIKDSASTRQVPATTQPKPMTQVCFNCPCIDVGFARGSTSCSVAQRALPN